ncbi:MAG: 5-bromo-4-chloroindolyl phosphate hydrolysis family protein [Oscillospiraceae bacterium]|jgi:hypothetical protein|nr:5-bromo-4-chloroindolyl phosphate hydrolysis family protein [Oscillospiraceae bacterium]
MSGNNKNNGAQSGGIGPWIGTIIMLFVFWPVGIFMLLGRLREAARWNKNAAQQRREAAPTPTPTPTATAAPARSYYDLAAQRAGAEPKKPSKKSAVAPNTPLERDKKAAKKISGWLVFVAVIGLLTGIPCLSVGIPLALTGGDIGGVIALFIVGGLFFTGGLASLAASRILPRRVKLRRRYFTLTGASDTVRVSALASSLGRSKSRVRRDLEAMLDDGYFGDGAYFDVGLDALVLDASAVKTARDAVQEAEAAAEIPISEYDRILNELRSLDEKIEDLAISSKIERIGMTSAKIFEAVKDNPEKLPQIRRFMNYYLPTTLKLLRSYVTLEKQGIRGENITSAKDSIDRVLGTLAAGFEQQLDQLFRSDVMDISSDIEVLENMMSRDGLSDDNPFRQQTSTGDLI